ncbi:uncharacterized protein LOC120110942 [Phoenix dactylifera]|uniref:Uncharacterized protein LOC120110942 n=1 Tax=Phoenix dactylifera TaxID=42345 RepID=A0A8B9AG26_PHODC|nr:uncharacterized protein LOC120110942 [Phoenix dactylifera]
MASFYSSSTLVCLTLVLLFGVQFTLGGITCESLARNTCAFAVSSSGMRCVLENRVRRGGQEEFSCRTSDIEAENLKDWVETDECIKACGLTRSTVGISSDSLLDPRFAQKLCSPPCYQECPNIVCSFQSYVRHNRMLAEAWKRSRAPVQQRQGLHQGRQRWPVPQGSLRWVSFPAQPWRLSDVLDMRAIGLFLMYSVATSQCKEGCYESMKACI